MFGFLSLIPRWAYIGIAVVLAGIAFMVWLDAREKAAVREHEADVRTEVVEKLIKAERAATAADAERAEQRAADSASTKGAISDAEKTQPAEVRKAAGPASRAAADSLRKRAERKAGNTPD